MDETWLHILSIWAAHRPNWYRCLACPYNWIWLHGNPHDDGR